MYTLTCGNDEGSSMWLLQQLNTRLFCSGFSGVQMAGYSLWYIRTVRLTIKLGVWEAIYSLTFLSL